jgi:hypothetical protein
MYYLPANKASSRARVQRLKELPQEAALLRVKTEHR